MVKYVSFDAYVCNASTYENVYEIGVYGFWLCEGPRFTGGSPFPSGQYDYFTNQLTSGGDVFGGSFLIAAEQETTGVTFAQYMPGSVPIKVPSEYITSSYSLKIVNKIGDFAICGPFNNSTNVFSVFREGVPMYSTLALSANGFIANKGILFYCILYCNSIELPLTNNAGFINFSLQSNNYWSCQNTTLDNDALYFLNNANIQDSPTPPGPTPGEDPYTPGGETEEGGGTGDFDNTGDAIEAPQPPTLTVDNTGFISLYNPSIIQLRDLATYLWSANFDIDTFKKIFSDPISTILGLTIVPVAPGLDGSRTVVLGNVSTGITMPKISNQYIRFDCGTLNVNEYWGGYLDYSPYTRAEIYLPFIGTKPINVDDIMGKAVHLVYNIDLLSGACCAMLECGGTTLYSFVGQCASSVPVTGRDMTQVINGILSVVGAGAGAFVATGNAGAAAVSAIGSLASNVTNMKPRVEKSGSMGGAAGMLGVRVPYLIITRPRQALPAAQGMYTGYPSYISDVLGNFSGYTEVQTIHLRETSATEAERAEIVRLLKEGVII